MSLTMNYCKSPELSKGEQKLCFQLASDFYDMIEDLDRKGYLRSELKLEKGEEERMHAMDVLKNVRKVTHAFNMFFDMYVDKIKPDSKQRLKRFLELNKPYGLTEEDLGYLLFSTLIFVFLQNIEEFRFALLFIMKLDKDKDINEQTTLGTLLWRLKELGIKKSDTLTDVDYELRNGLSHCLYWFDENADSECSEPHLHYSKDIEFQSIDWISITDLYSKTRNQSIYSSCLLNVIGDWFG